MLSTQNETSVHKGKQQVGRLNFVQTLDGTYLYLILVKVP